MSYGPKQRELLQLAGIDPDVFGPEWESRHDEETAHWALEAEERVVPRLRLRGWVRRFRGGDGIGGYDQPRLSLRLIHSVAREADGEIWGHVSVSRRDRVMPSWEQARDVQWLVYPELVGIIVVAPAAEHVSKAEVAHVWTCLTRRVLPDFSFLGSI